MPVFFAYLLKRGTTLDDQKRPETTYNEQETTWNNLERVRNDLKRPTTSKKRPETTYNKQEMTWDDLQRARNNLKRPGTTYSKKETTWSHLLWARNDLKRSTSSKWQHEKTCREQILTSWSPSIWKIINWRASMSQRSGRSFPWLQYFVSCVHMKKNQCKCQDQTKQSKKTLNNNLIS